MICPNWLKCQCALTDCGHLKVHDYVPNDECGRKFPKLFKGCDKVATLGGSPEECEANTPGHCMLYPCLRVVCGGCIGVEDHPTIRRKYGKREEHV